jgi:hypothetical protein
MSWPSLTPAARRAIRDAAAKAYQRELTAELGRLHNAFVEWKAGSLSATELSTKLHRRSAEVERELAKDYKYNANLDLAVARAIDRGVLAEDEIAEPAREHLRSLIAK